MEEWLCGFQSSTFEMKTGAAKLVEVRSAIAGSMTTAILPAGIVFGFDQVAWQHAAQKGGPLRGHSGKGLIARCSLEVSRAPPFVMQLG